jgi:cytochrome c peroxidase
MKKTLLAVFSMAFLAVGLHNCTPSNEFVTTDYSQLNLPAQPFDYKAGVQNFVNDLPLLNANKPQGNFFFDPNSNKLGGMLIQGTGFNSTQIKNEVATLGRVLFYDKKMSINNTVACGNCHLQSKAFSDVGSVSTGFKTTKTTRNSMAITNPALTNNLFWDSRSRSLQEMVLKPVQNHIEMGMEDLSFLVGKLQKTDYYPALFKKAFGTEGVSEQNINTALMQFLASMVTHNSKFDTGLKTKFANFNGLELSGKDLFMSERLACTKCHTGANFSLGDDQSFDNPYGSGGSGTFSNNTFIPGGAAGTANIGLNMVYKDNGRGEGKFKIPSLRNIELTTPYMHDGRFVTLEQVVEHYNSGVQAHPSLDANLKDNTGQPRQLNLTTIEKTALVAFLKTLTDNVYTTDVKYSDPFKY